MEVTSFPINNAARWQLRARRTSWVMVLGLLPGMMVGCSPFTGHLNHQNEPKRVRCYSGYHETSWHAPEAFGFHSHAGCGVCNCLSGCQCASQGMISHGNSTEHILEPPTQMIVDEPAETISLRELLDQHSS